MLLQVIKTSQLRKPMLDIQDIRATENHSELGIGHIKV